MLTSQKYNIYNPEIQHIGIQTHKHIVFAEATLTTYHVAIDHLQG
jgi:hypothetical protein